MVFVSVAAYMIGMLLIGYWAYKRTSNLSEYMLGGRTLGPAVTALSAGASDMSGWLLMGLPGAMYAQGLSASWIVIGLTLGAYANWLYVAPRLRVYTEVANDSITIPEFLENRFGDTSKLLRLISGFVIMIFFTFYVSSGLVSGAVLFQNSFGISYHAGLWIVAGVVVAYTLFGGFLAVSWTDFVQGTIMFLALLLVPAVTLFHTGGVGDTVATIRSIDPNLLDLWKGTSFLGIISLFAWGLGYFGQPHIIVRFMAISSVKEMKSARRIGMGWMVFSVAGAMLTGLFGIAYFSQRGAKLDDPETVFIQLGEILFHPLITGFLLSAILAAIMSTISSQLLVTSSSLTEDLYKILFRRSASDKELVFVGRLAVFIVALVASALAYTKNDTILNLVGYAWAGFGASFGPVILLSLFWRRMTKWGAFAGMVAGAATVILWTQSQYLKNLLYEMIPGFAASLLAIVVVSLLTKAPEEKIIEQFDKFKQALQ
ncbi:sodium/proline symporter PutP [Parageobacillus thermoglucosidasius]|uniref:Sodium/proline symporter n=1 Tax=Parageobacillus thermoglucosidasius TaxID=1426 RepID=A0AAN1D5L1_PARTM|nr:sodium/proline symporter PutP [Parageobacillus thermoglucosidasius]ALF09136.1 proline:sodium symporter PutP [Parageobacillus thermoglucosidasius]ANZ29218.1 sodium/proline symporter [Parageobacillus thermoglucosidasius]APM79956.1 sodium/proline symporter [Parageobacillus thermoglucosidasius]KJX70032.1 proline:sodium symporter PutP [Parageobacillus thermoglucosidasius]MBY6266670.1 sodium/proline symporter PutP [Parageobacillus thermoglucosidasius]